MRRLVSVLAVTLVAGVGGFFVGRLYERDAQNDGTFPIHFDER